MKMKNWIATIFVCSSVSFVLTSAPPPCPSDGIVPDSDCSKYWQCINGLAYQLSCPTSTHFNPKLNVCDHPKSAGCTGQGWSAASAQPIMPEPARPKPTSVAATTESKGCWEGLIYYPVCPWEPSPGPTTPDPITSTDSKGCFWSLVYYPICPFTSTAPAP